MKEVIEILKDLRSAICDALSITRNYADKVNLSNRINKLDQVIGFLEHLNP